MRWTSKSNKLAAVAVLLVASVGWLAFLWNASRPQNSKQSLQDEMSKSDRLLQDELPASWSLEEIAKETPPYGMGTEGVCVLAWQSWGDEKWRGDSCLVMRVLDKDSEHGRWRLAHLGRNVNSPNPKWQVSMMHVSSGEGTKYFPGVWLFHATSFKVQPTNKDIYAACTDIEGVYWSFEPDNGSRLIGAGVCEQNWLKVIGEKPTRFFRQAMKD